MTIHWKTVVTSGVVLLALYGAYLLLGGTAGREWIKTRVAVVRSDASVVIHADGAGCESVGEWHAETRTCSLERDPVAGETFRIAGDSVALDGRGHTLRGPTSRGPAIFIGGVTGAVVRNLRVVGFSEGILLFGSVGAVIRDTRMDSIGGHAIRIMGGSRFNRIVDNDVRYPDLHGVALWRSHGNLIAGNALVGARDAVRIQQSSGNVVVSNRMVGSLIEGVDVHMASGNTVINNDLIEPLAAPLLDDSRSADANTYGVRWGGNYVSRFDEPAEGCVDEDDDDRCDSAYEFYGQRAVAPQASSITDVGAEPIWDEDASWGVVFERAASPSSAIVICSGCHDLGNGEDAGVGPSLARVLGRPVAADADFAYSRAMREAGGTWTRERLGAFITDPTGVVPGTSMAFPGIPDEAVVAAILEYLEGL